MEGKAAVSEALKDSQAQNGCMLALSSRCRLRQVERDVEFAEFGRVYRSFRRVPWIHGSAVRAVPCSALCQATAS